MDGYKLTSGHGVYSLPRRIQADKSCRLS